MFVGQNVTLEAGKGTIRFHGRTQFAPGVWVGVELTQPVGKNDGSVGGISYFSCPPNHGIFVRESKVRPETSHAAVASSGGFSHVNSQSLTSTDLQVEAVKKQLEACQQSVDAAESKIEMLAVDREVLETENEALRQELDALQAKYNELKQELDALLEESELNRQLEQLVSAQVDVSDLSEEEIKSVLVKNKALEQKLEDNSQRLQAMSREIQTLAETSEQSALKSASLSRLEQKLAHSKEIIDSLQAQLDTNLNVDDIVGRLTEENHELTAKIQALETNVSELTELVELDRGLEEKHAEVEAELKNSLSEMSTENHRINARIQQLQVSNKHLRDKLDELKDVHKDAILGEESPVARPNIHSFRLAQSPPSSLFDCIYTANEITCLAQVILNRLRSAFSARIFCRYQSLERCMRLLVTSLEWNLVKGDVLLSNLSQILDQLSANMDMQEYDLEGSDFILSFILNVLELVPRGKFYARFTTECCLLHLKSMKSALGEISSKDIDAYISRLVAFREELEKWNPEDDAEFKALASSWYETADLFHDEPHSEESASELLSQLDPFLSQERKPQFKLGKDFSSSKTTAKPPPVDAERLRKIHDLELNVDILHKALETANINHQKAYKTVYDELVNIKQKHSELKLQYSELESSKSKLEKELANFQRFESYLADLYKDPNAESGMKKVSLRALAYKSEAEFLRRVVMDIKPAMQSSEFGPLVPRLKAHINPLGGCGHYLQKLAMNCQPVRVRLSNEWVPRRESAEYIVAVQKEDRCRYEAMRESAFGR
ncbi:CAP-Gly domain-containing linker protein 3 [Meyerozyma sp. JA9]|nr:CAP-Gly domain-containing linker protein 3 [Meyerozyma sp. JA9]